MNFLDFGTNPLDAARLLREQLTVDYCRFRECGMDFETRKSEIARELTPEFGEEVVAETEKRLSGQVTRGFGITLSDAVAYYDT
jgi:hypothetical protein